MDAYHPQLILLLSSLSIALLFDRLAWLRRRPHADRGDFWVFMVKYLCLSMGILLILSAWQELLLKPVWAQGYHLFFDVLAAPSGWLVSEWSMETRYLIALSIPAAVWLSLLVLKGLLKPADKHTARWLAGGISKESNSRRWLLYYTIPFILILIFTYNSLGGGPGAYPAALWSTLLLLVISMLGVALSTGKPAVAAAKKSIRSTTTQTLNVNPWPQALREQGIELTEKIAWWPATSASRTLQGQYAQNLAKRLEFMGAKAIAPELIEAIAALLSPSQDNDMRRMIFAPDDCGQLETVALAATLLEQRYHTSTVVIVHSGAAQLAARFNHWLPVSKTVAQPAAAMGIGTEIEKQTDAQIWVVEADILSDLLMPMLKQHGRIAEKVGLVVWWHLEAYTGVLGANLWAISRRLDRLLKVKGREDIRVLALVRQTAYADDQITRFVSRLLPPTFASQTTVQVPRHFVKPIHVHLINGHQGFFQASDAHKTIPEQFRHLALTATKASVDAQWHTHLHPPSETTTLEAQGILQLPIEDTLIGKKLYTEVAEADARLYELHPDEVLSLSEIVSQGGRASETGHPHHIGLTPPDNPYVTYLLRLLQQRRQQDNVTDFGFGLSRRLVGAEPHASVISRHLLMALSELPDTKENLKSTLLGEEQAIDDTLDVIAGLGLLSKSEVRYLRKKRAAKSNEPTLAISVRYQTTHSKNLRQPLDTVGLSDSLIDIKDPTKGDDAVLKRIDPERITILAYPHRIFMHQGHRYHIREWHKDTVLKQKYILCEEETRYAKTWRIRHTSVYNVIPLDAAVDTSHKAGAFMRFRARLDYEEVVTGALFQQFNLTQKVGEAPERLHLTGAPISQTISTQALILGFPETKSDKQLNALCQVLRYIIPVHLGVDENALEVVKFAGEDKNSLPVYGIAIVDLYPDGIGLIDAIYDDHKLILKMWEWGLKWLQHCDCEPDKKNLGCAQCLRTVSALAAVNDDETAWPTRSDAIAILSEVIKIDNSKF